LLMVFASPALVAAKQHHVKFHKQHHKHLKSSHYKKTHI
jgi:hypothetical protein